MKAKALTRGIAICIALGEALSGVISAKASGVSLEDQLECILAKERAGDPNAPSEMNRLAMQHGRELTPALLKHFRDGDADTRSLVTSAFRPIQDERAVVPLLGQLSDKVSFVADEAMTVLDRYPREWLRKRTDVALPLLTAFAERTYNSSGRTAILLLGDMQNRSVISQLQKMLKKVTDLEGTEAVKTKWDPRWASIPALKQALREALTKLGDDATTKDVLALLHSEKVTDKAFAIEAIEYAERRELLPQLVPLPSDARDAVNVAPSGGEYYLRVQDPAGYVLEKLLDLRIVPERNRRSYMKPRLTDEQLSQIWTGARQSLRP